MLPFRDQVHGSTTLTHSRGTTAQLRGEFAPSHWNFEAKGNPHYANNAHAHHSLKAANENKEWEGILKTTVKTEGFK